MIKPFLTVAPSGKKGRGICTTQNIADVAELINEYPEYEDRIIANLSIHRAASTFKILDFTTQKRIVAELPSFNNADDML